MQQTLLDHLDIWTNAIETRSTSGRGNRSKLNLYGIKKLRELILDLAVRGQLVPQDPNDEPASVLLEKIAAEKEQLIKAGKVKKQKALPPIGEDEKPFELPTGWYWIRLGDVGLWAIGSGFPKSIQGIKNESILFSKVSDMNLFGNEKYITHTSNTINEEIAYKLKIKIHPKGTVIFPKIGGAIATNKRRILSKPTAIDNNCLGIIPTQGIICDYLFIYLMSLDFTKYQAGTSVPALSQSVLEMITSGLPPLAEQHRIVAKVNELMSLCDALEQAQTQHIQAHQTLVEHLLAALTQAANQGDFEQAWARIAEHFDTLFTTEHSIDQLKQTLLQLAVMGKLVPQDPNDEPASVLLEKIAAEKAQLIKDKKIKKQKALPPITDEEKPFALPDGWAWCRLANVFALVTDGDHQAPPKSDTGIPFLVISNLNSGKVIFDGCKFVPNDYYEKLDWGRKPKKEDLLYTVTGSFGISVKNDEERKFCVQRHVAILKSTFSTPTDYLFNYLKSSYAFNYSSSIATGIAQKTVPLTGLRKMLVALPSEKEQQKIIKKINQITTICDQLKTQLAKQQTTQNQLADALTTNAYPTKNE